ncbi:MAG: site-2 protease family protein [Acidimicrobiia bacterium]|nr:site-2 protease family protein [Acidimicrobiia bacterium]MYC57276.1 site-2 protease family protein [Acidimicrobiia bacterium]MYG94480.1 site-2 protease family protein [Acidimicrobiia bacterium]MYI30934.1 site-2 protease family protein [Acidimicrobiia bacterium]
MRTDQSIQTGRQVATTHGSSARGSAAVSGMTGIWAHRQSWGPLLLLVGFLVVLGVFYGLPLLIVLLAIIVMIYLHELGHYLTARAAGMKVTEFFLGFGPKLWSTRRGETLYGLKAIPAGAYVRIIGMNNLDEVPADEEHLTYRSKPYWRRMSVAVAGSTMHFLLAFGLIFSFLVVGGKTERIQSSDWTISVVSEGSPAQQAGLLAGDRIVSVDGQLVATMGEMIQALPPPTTSISLGVQRDGVQFVQTLILGTHPLDATRAYIGIGSRSAYVSESVEVGYFKAVPETFREFGYLVKESVLSIGRFFSPSGLSNFYRDLTNQPAEQPSTPSQGVFAPSEGLSDDEARVISIFGALQIGADLTENSYVNLLVFLALLNVFVGVFNMIPLLPLDGGHVVIATYERLRSRRDRRYIADVSKMIPVAYGVILVLLFVGLGALYLDITDPVELPG